MHKYSLPILCSVIGLVAGSILSYVVVLVPWMEARVYRPPPEIITKTVDWRYVGESLDLIGGSKGDGVCLFQAKDVDFEKTLDWFLLARNTGSKYIYVNSLSNNFQLTNSQGQSLKVSAVPTKERLLLSECTMFRLRVEKTNDTTNNWNLVLHSFAGFGSGNAHDVVISNIRFAVKK
jgi:hypothetical protein